MSAVGAVAAQAASGSDRDLVRAVRAHDDEAFEELYRRYRAPITRYVMTLVHDEGRAEDVAQEAFVSALRRIRETDCEIRFRPWIYEIARNAAIDQHRRTSRTEEVPLAADGAIRCMRPAASAAPEASFLEKERLDHLRGAMGELSETAQRIVVLREFEGLSYNEIGERMQLSSAAVESALFRARRKLEHEYEQIDTGRRCALMRSVIARMAEGVESGRNRRRLDRHVRSCWSCRRRAHALGVGAGRLEPRSRRAGAFLPFPGLLHRLVFGPRPAPSGAREATGILSSPAAESVVQGVQKAAVVLASAIAIGGGGATLGGVGPLAPDRDGTAAHTQGAAAQDRPAPATARKERTTAGSRSRDREDAAHPDGRKPDRPGSGEPASHAPSSSPQATGAPGLPAPVPPAGSGASPIPGPGTPSLPQVPRPAAPQLPSLPAASAPDTPALPDLPEIPDVPGVGVLPTAGLVPDTSEVTAPARGVVPPP
jgi:RNA polymerase sigma factor (sigma-70 family)